MRLKEFEIRAIKEAVRSMDSKAKVYLFGSRVDDTKKGGDIDLLIISGKLELGDKYKIYSKITHTLEDQKIDIIINNGVDTNYFIYDALRNGLKL
ncbi:MAG: nucleotidyltransferase domain-containing protein [Ignavibacteria bacterium]|nr:nucleotidyltransferase domain-containing protein [Ignavibacteria bacterium]MBK7160368.1 nucleotidyltransferase domain-containing protein [Ignavibacteria bacterium]MBK9406434.1 nucleotidyltransferase domain-containing protein [Ignavibacteria bacterium]